MIVLIIQPVRYVTRRECMLSSDGGRTLKKNGGNLERDERDALPIGKPRVNVLLRQGMSGGKCGRFT